MPITTALSPSQVQELAAGNTGRGGGDPRVAAKVLEFRELFPFPRRVLAEVTGVNYTTLLRIEQNKRDFTLYTLTGFLVGARRLVKQVQPNQLKTYDVWVRELFEVLAVLEREKHYGRLWRTMEKQRHADTITE